MKSFLTMLLLAISLTSFSQIEYRIGAGISPSILIPLYEKDDKSASFLSYWFDFEAEFGVMLTKSIGVRTGLLYSRNRLMEHDYTISFPCDYLVEDYEFNSYHKNSISIDYSGFMISPEFILSNRKTRLSILPGYEYLFQANQQTSKRIIRCGAELRGFNGSIASIPNKHQHRVKLALEFAHKINATNELVIRPQAKYGLNNLLTNDTIIFDPPFNQTAYSRVLSAGIHLGFRRVLGTKPTEN